MHHAAGDYKTAELNNGKWVKALKPVRRCSLMPKLELEIVFIRLWRKVYWNGSRGYFVAFNKEVDSEMLQGLPNCFNIPFYFCEKFLNM